jgi:hypothetical protein
VLVSWEENFKPRRASTDEAAGQELTRAFSAYVDSATDEGSDVITWLAALVGDGAPRKHFPHPRYPLSRCVRVTADADDEHPLLWRVAADYAEPPPQPGQDQDQPSKEPHEQEPVYSATFRREERYDTLDKGYVDAGPPAVNLAPLRIANTADDLFATPPATYRGAIVLRVVRYALAVNVTELEENYYNKVNNAPVVTPIGTFGVDSLLLTGLSVSPKTIKGWRGYELQMEAEYRRLPPEGERPVDPAGLPDPGHPSGRGFAPLPANRQLGGWLPTGYLSEGWNEKAGGLLKPVAAPAGQQLANPVRLNVDGSKAQAADPNTYVFYFLYERADLAQLLT